MPRCFVVTLTTRLPSNTRVGCGSCVEGEKLANAKKLLNSKVSVLKKRQRKEEEARDKYSTVDEEQRGELIAKVSSVRWSITGSRCGAAHPSSDTPVSLWPFVFVLVCCCICAWSPCEAVARPPAAVRPYRCGRPCSFWVGSCLCDWWHSTVAHPGSGTPVSLWPPVFLLDAALQAIHCVGGAHSQSCAAYP